MSGQSALKGLLLVVVANLGCLTAKPIADSGPGNASFSCCPASAAKEAQPVDAGEAQAGEADVGEGTRERPFLLRQANIEDFNRQANTPEGLKQHYQLTENIVLPNKPNNWTAIGTQKAPFTGSFDGAGFTISGLHIHAVSTHHQGLFGYIGADAQITNLGLLGVNISSVIGSVADDSGFAAGGIVGKNAGGTVQNAYATGSIQGGAAVGGIVGSNSGKVQDCYATSHISGLHNVGGIVGYNDSMVQNCHATGNISAKGNAGGVVGQNYGGTVQNCHATGNISGDSAIGGVAGNNSGTVQHCYATGSISGDRGIGGVVGHNLRGTVQHCHATGSISGESGIGGVAGANTGTVQNCYATGSISAKSISAGRIGGVVGTNTGTVQNSYATGSVSIQGGSAAGGVVGRHEGTLQDCYATGSISSKGGHAVGGVVGSNAGAVQNCYATGSVHGGDHVGGVVGTHYDDTARRDTRQSLRIVQNCVALNASVTQRGSIKTIGRLVGKRWGKKLPGNYARDNMTLTVHGNAHSPKNGSPEDGQAITQYNNEDFWRTTLGWNFSDVWQWGGALPLLRNVGGTQNP